VRRMTVVLHVSAKMNNRALCSHSSLRYRELSFTPK